MKRIVLVGDYNGTSAAHRAIPNALAMAADTLHAETNPDAHDPVIAPLMCRCSKSKAHSILSLGHGWRRSTADQLQPRNITAASD